MRTITAVMPAKPRRPRPGTRHAPRSLATGAFLLVTIVGPACGPPVAVDPLPFIPRGEAIAGVNHNSAMAMGKRLKLQGSWAGTFGSKGEWLDGGFLMDVALPDHLRFRDRGLMAKRFQVGCTSDTAWFWQKYPDNQDHMRIATREDSHLLLGEEVTILPQDLIDCLGLSVNSTREPAVLFRVSEEHNQFLHARVDADGHQYLARETWASRRHPDRIERVLFRDPEGRVVLDAKLTDHHAVQDSSLQMAHAIDIQMPTSESAMELRISGVTIMDQQRLDMFRDPDIRAKQDPDRTAPRRVCWFGNPPQGRQSRRCNE